MRQPASRTVTRDHSVSKKSSRALHTHHYVGVLGEYVRAGVFRLDDFGGEPALDGGGNVGEMKANARVEAVVAQLHLSVVTY